MRLVLPDIPISPNRLRGVHWAKKKRIADYWKSLIRSVIVPNGRCSVRMQVRITFHHAREYDQDNSYAAVKPVVDALKHWGLIRDDSSEWLVLDVQQAHCPHKQRHTEIEIAHVS